MTHSYSQSASKTKCFSHHSSFNFSINQRQLHRQFYILTKNHCRFFPGSASAAANNIIKYLKTTGQVSEEEDFQDFFSEYVNKLMQVQPRYTYYHRALMHEKSLQASQMTKPLTQIFTVHTGFNAIPTTTTIIQQNEDFPLSFSLSISSQVHFQAVRYLDVSIQK